MGTWTIHTTATEDDAITYAYQQSQKPIAAPPGAPPTARTAETLEMFFDRRTHEFTIAPMVSVQQRATDAEVLETLGTIPPENRDAAEKELEALVVKHGGTVELREVRYKWSKNTAAPPSTQSVELNATDANVAGVTKFTAHYLDAEGVDRMTALLAIAVNTTIRIEDPARPATFVQVVTTAAPIQRQGANGYVEFAIVYSASGGQLAPLDGLPVVVMFG